MNRLETFASPLQREILIDFKIPTDSISSYPTYHMRGHMISYRSISNAYDGWTVEVKI